MGVCEMMRAAGARGAARDAGLRRERLWGFERCIVANINFGMCVYSMEDAVILVGFAEYDS